ncbi:9268_t:CDS:2 [Ambispora gerdemannii]|uniref:9268_t:CDS:1 n=1 Tax=Ambispora gerdemannii TaxID=144530 RepID=A0A9N9G190_9GLOM|nr:9268_t:CDS:2 [Ambispora gerdemannii]
MEVNPELPLVDDDKNDIEKSSLDSTLLKQHSSSPEEHKKIQNDLYVRRLQTVEEVAKATILKETWEEEFKSTNGIIVDKYSIEQSIDPVIDSPKPIIEYKKSQNMKISYASKKCDSFRLSEGIEIDASSSEDLRKFFVLLDMHPRNHSDNAFLNELETHDVYCEIASEQVSIEYNIQNIEITAEFKDAIGKALKTNTPIEDLKRVFNKFGHLFTTKIIIGNKLQRMVRLNGEKDKENHVSIYHDIGNESLSLWKEKIQPYDSSYLWTMDGDPIEINQISNWLETIPLFELEWHIIKRIVTPLYKILCINQRKEIEKLFSKQDHILITNTTEILAFNTGYQRIEFNSKLKSRNYQIFGKIVDANGKELPNIYVKFSLKSEYGFSVNWIRAGDKNFSINLQTLSLEWRLIGCPSEIGYFDSTTRDKEIKTGSTELKIASNKEAPILEVEDPTQQWSCRINTCIDKPDKPLSSSSISLNLEYPTTRKAPIFKASYKILQQFYSIIEVKVELIKAEYVEFLNEDEEITVTIRWCVI